MEWIEVFVATSQIGLEPVEGVLYQCGLTGLMIHDEADFVEFLENPNREWDYVTDELVEEKEELETGITFFLCRKGYRAGKRLSRRNYLFPAR